MARTADDVRAAVPADVVRAGDRLLARFWEPGAAPFAASALTRLVDACAGNLSEGEPAPLPSGASAASAVVDGWASNDTLKIAAVDGDAVTGLCTVLVGTERVDWLPRSVLDGFQSSVAPGGLPLCVGAFLAVPEAAAAGAVLAYTLDSWRDALAGGDHPSVLFVDGTGQNAWHLERFLRHLCRRLGAEVASVWLPRAVGRRSLFAVCPPGRGPSGPSALG